MNRRAFLQGTGALGALTLAGCMADDDSGSGTPTPDSGDDATPTITGSSIERTDKGCNPSEHGYASSSMDEETLRVSFSGRVETGNPCYQPTIENTAYDEETDKLTITIGTEAKEKACIDCVGYIDFSGTVDFSGALPGNVAVVNDGETLSPASGDAGSDGASDDATPAIQASSFSVTNIDSSSPERSADAEFDEDAGEVVVTGTIVGDDGCTTADIGSASYVAEDNRLDVNVVTKTREDAEDRYCTQQRVGIDYEATVSFDNGIPSTASVSHDGQGVMSAGYGSTSASAPDSDDGSTPDA